MRWPGLLLLGMAVAAHAAEPAGFFRNPDLPTIDIVQFEAVGRAGTTLYGLTLSIVPIRSADTLSAGFGFGNTPGLLPSSEWQKEIAWATNANWTKYVGHNRASWSSSLRFESHGERLEIRPRRHSLSVRWRKIFP